MLGRGVNVGKKRNREKNSPKLGKQKPDLPQETCNPEPRGKGCWHVSLYWDSSSLHCPASRLSTMQERVTSQQSAVSPQWRAQEPRGGGPAKYTNSSYWFSSFKSGEHKLKMNHRTHTNCVKWIIPQTFSCSSCN